MSRHLPSLGLRLRSRGRVLAGVVSEVVLGLPIRLPRRRAPLLSHPPVGWSGRPRRTLSSAEVGGKCKAKGGCSLGVRECQLDFSSNLGGRCRGVNRCSSNSSSRDFKEAWDQEGLANPGSLWRSSPYNSSSGGQCHSNSSNSRNKGLVCSSNSPRCSGEQPSPGCSSSGGRKWPVPSNRGLSLAVVGVACSRGSEVQGVSEPEEEGGCLNKGGLCNKGLAACNHSSSNRCRVSSLAGSTSPGCNRVSNSCNSHSNSSSRSRSLTGVGWWLDPGKSRQASLAGAMQQHLLLPKCRRHPRRSSSTGEAVPAGWTIPPPLGPLGRLLLRPGVLRLHRLAVTKVVVVGEGEGGGALRLLNPSRLVHGTHSSKSSSRRPTPWGGVRGSWLVGALEGVGGLAVSNSSSLVHHRGQGSEVLREQGSGAGLQERKGQGLEVLKGQGLEVLKGQGLEVLKGQGLEVLKGQVLEVLKGRGSEVLKGQGSEVPNSRTKWQQILLQ